MIDDEEDYHDWGPMPRITLKHKSVDHALYMWLTEDVFSVMLWERRGDADKLLKALQAMNHDDAMHIFALQMNELEMY